MLKKEILEASLAKGKTKVWINPRVPGVKLPSHLMNEFNVILNLSMKFGQEVMIDNNALATKLSFNGELHSIVLPWLSFQAIQDHETGKISIFADAFTAATTEEVIVDRSEELQLKIVEFDEKPLLSPPRRGHLKLAN